MLLNGQLVPLNLTHFTGIGNTLSDLMTQTNTAVAVASFFPCFLLSVK